MILKKTPVAWFFLIMLAVIWGSCFILIKISSPVFASSVTYLIPMFAIFWGVIDGEKFKLEYLAWISLVLGDLFLVYIKLPEKKKIQT